MAPEPEMNVPGGVRRHDVCPENGWYVPGAHSV
jgi:hypothetical protein